ncbi:hypothetical protein DFH08DRAFT_954785 [Mycena albidolilacea]|uniref:Uncharacterized protein n=1 Tax=Mycena albidolilacea TaxID=1033008 RepID=A0AAD7EWK4_9AGAR|nr:hypothetical protein DFH08DRAFT_954785 [Mycena albidolilacea]
MLAFSALSLVVLVSLAVPTVSLTNTSIPHFHTIPLQPSTWQELATSHFYIPLILLASALGRFIGVCVAYSPLSAGCSCLCGHGEDEHLPERGGCTDTHCMKFQTVTYLAGDPGRTPCTSFTSLHSDNGSGGVVPPFYNGHGRIPGLIRRRSAAAHHHAFGPATGASMPRGPHRPFSTSRLSSAAIKPPR